MHLEIDFDLMADDLSTSATASIISEMDDSWRYKTDDNVKTVPAALINEEWLINAHLEEIPLEWDYPEDDEDYQLWWLGDYNDYKEDLEI